MFVFIVIPFCAFCLFTNLSCAARAANLVLRRPIHSTKTPTTASKHSAGQVVSADSTA